jgi:hypothetical protein
MSNGQCDAATGPIRRQHRGIGRLVIAKFHAWGAPETRFTSGFGRGHADPRVS